MNGGLYGSAPLPGFSVPLLLTAQIPMLVEMGRRSTARANSEEFMSVAVENYICADEAIANGAKSLRRRT